MMNDRDTLIVTHLCVIALYDLPIEIGAVTLKAILTEMLPNCLDCVSLQIVPIPIHMQSIPYDIKKEIVSFLGIQDSYHVCLTCKDYAAIFKDQQYWRARAITLGWNKPIWNDSIVPFVEYVGFELPIQPRSIRGSELYYTKDHCLKSAIVHRDMDLFLSLLREESCLPAKIFELAIKHGTPEMLEKLEPLTIYEDKEKVLMDYVVAGTVENLLFLLKKVKVVDAENFGNFVPLIDLIESESADRWEYSCVFMSAARHNMPNLFSRFVEPEPHTFMNRAAIVAAEHGSKDVLLECLRHISNLDAQAAYLAAIRHHQLAMANLIRFKRKVRVPIIAREVATLACSKCTKGFDDIVPTTANLAAVLNSGREDLFIDLIESTTCKLPEMSLSAWLRIAFKNRMNRAALHIAGRMSNVMLDDILPLVRQGNLMSLHNFIRVFKTKEKLTLKEQAVLAEAAIDSGSSEMMMYWCRTTQLVDKKYILTAANNHRCSNEVSTWVNRYIIR